MTMGAWVLWVALGSGAPGTYPIMVVEFATENRCQMALGLVVSRSQHHHPIRATCLRVWQT